MNTEDHGAMTIDYEQSLFPSLVRRASEMKSARRGAERRGEAMRGARGKSAFRSQFSRGADYFLADIFSLARRTTLGKGTARSLL